MSLTNLIPENIRTIPGRVRELVTPTSKKEMIGNQLRQLIERLELNQVVSNWIAENAESFDGRYSELGMMIRKEFQIYSGVYVKIGDTIYYVYRGKGKLKLDSEVVEKAERPPYDLTIKHNGDSH